MSPRCHCKAITPDVCAISSTDGVIGTGAYAGNRSIVRMRFYFARALDGFPYALAIHVDRGLAYEQERSRRNRLLNIYSSQQIATPYGAVYRQPQMLAQGRPITGRHTIRPQFFGFNPCRSPRGRQGIAPRLRRDRPVAQSVFYAFGAIKGMLHPPARQSDGAFLFACQP